MKKLLSVLLIVSMVFAMGALLASCEYEPACEYSDKWTTDATHHWHACTDEACELVADKAEHTWDGGALTTTATREKEGVKTYTCTVCAATKTEPVPFTGEVGDGDKTEPDASTGMTEEEWNAALADSVFVNFTYQEVVSVTATGLSMETEAIYKFTEDAAWGKMTVAGTSEEEFAPNTKEANEARDALAASIREMAPYAKYAYDAESKTYKATSEIYLESLEGSTSDITLTFEGGKLVKIAYSADVVENGISMTATSVITLSDYGTVVLNP